MAIVIHLQYCDQLIQLLSSGGSPWQRRAQLQKLSAQTQLLEELGEISTECLGSITSAADVLPGLAERPGLMALWSECSGSGGQFHTTLDRVLKHMHHSYTSPLQERHPHTTAETGRPLFLSVCLCLKTFCVWRYLFPTFTKCMMCGYAAATCAAEYMPAMADFLKQHSLSDDQRISVLEGLSGVCYVHLTNQKQAHSIGLYATLQVA
ncbi:unnamed protein product [Oncorhynchus mykiss]|uniref:Uncharacterized protein n=1 Tax=Oncorhynchus mykiss TaxID=8022 RepID=A0A060X9J6_ONCMY|nr:unnamed protein product [Oncorhynchus mykiss]